MEPIKLNDLLGIDLTSEEYRHGRITFNTELLDTWLSRSDEESRIGPNFSFSAKNTTNTKTLLHEGDMVVVAVQLDSSDKWLLAFISKVTKIHYDKPCERVAVEKYRKWFNRVIFRMSKKAQGYNFTLETFLDRCEVIEVLEKEYGGKPFPGYFNLNIKMRELLNYLNNANLGADWKSKLSAVKGIYCLNNHAEGKCYIGSAYNDNGCLLKRWKDYFNSLHGGNVEFKKLKEAHPDDEYWLDNIHFSILEIFPDSVDDNYILDREHYWMGVFNSHDPRCGYNKN